MVSIYFGIRFNRKGTEGEFIWPRLRSKSQTAKSYLDFTSTHNHVESGSDVNAFRVALGNLGFLKCTCEVLKIFVWKSQKIPGAPD